MRLGAVFSKKVENLKLAELDENFKRNPSRKTLNKQR